MPHHPGHRGGKGRGGKRWTLSLVWALPAIAAAISITLLIQTLSSRGPTISVAFRTAEGLVPGKTAVRYKSVDVGVVSAVRLAPDHTKVIATVALTHDAEAFARQGSTFWVVRPRIATTGVSGLETLLSGAYVGVDPAKQGAREAVFEGLDAPPILTSDAAGKQFVLRATDLGSLDVGSPVYFRRIPVGQVLGYQLGSDGRDVLVRVFVRDPYSRFVTVDTRFWHASGVDLQLDAKGLQLNVQSLATILLGGVAFRSPGDGSPAPQAAENAEFALASDESSALKASDDGAPLLAVLNFDQSVRGLSPGAPVEFRGIPVGKVRSIGIEFRREEKSFRMPVVVELYPSRIGIGRRDLTDKAYGHAMAEVLNKQGLRAQLRTGNLLTGQLFVSFEFFPNAPPAPLHLGGALPELPTVPGSLDELQSKIGSIVTKLDRVPFDQIGNDLGRALRSADRVMNTAGSVASQLDRDILPQATQTMTEARSALQSVNSTLDPEDGVQADARRMMQELTGAARSMRELADSLKNHPESVIRGKPEGEGR
nr:MlaD family protein [uncultured Cupriavidus sp.]